MAPFSDTRVSKDSSTPEPSRRDPDFKYVPNDRLSPPLGNHCIPKIVQLISDNKAGKLDSETNLFILEYDDYRSLLTLLEKKGLDNYARIDYDPGTRALAVRMGSTIYGTVSNSFARLLEDKIAMFGAGQRDLQQWTNNIKFGVAGPLEFYDKKERRTHRRWPCAHVWYKTAPLNPWPCLVVEIGYSQSSESLEAKADDYILRSTGVIATVIGIHLGYNGLGYGALKANVSDRHATVSIWHAVPAPHGKGVEIRRRYEHECKDSQGQPTGNSFDLLLSDFINPALMSQVPICTITIHSNELCALLEEAELFQAATEAH